MRKAIEQVSPMNKTHIKYLARYLNDFNSKSLLPKKKFIKPILVFFQKPIVNGLMFIACNLLLCGLIGLIAVAIALNISLK